MRLNERARERCQVLVALPEDHHVQVLRADSGTRLIDCGVSAGGGLEAGRIVAETCMAGLGKVQLVPAPAPLDAGPAVLVSTDHPVAACMASQYAGWQISGDTFFAMGSGPMRSAAGKETLFDTIGLRESPQHAVGVLESSQLPPDDVCRQIAQQCGVAPTELTLLAARTASITGTIQVVARSVETALHKMHDLGMDIAGVRSGFGVVPLPPVAADDLTGIGRTNDAVLYGGLVTLWWQGDDEPLEQLGRQVPSNASSDYGQPFLEIFEKYDRDFYKIDPHLFSPAVVTFLSLASGRSFTFGQLRPDLLRASLRT